MCQYLTSITMTTLVCCTISINKVSFSPFNCPFSPEDQTDEFASNVDPDETAHNKSSYLEEHCLPFCSCFLANMGSRRVPSPAETSIGLMMPLLEFGRDVLVQELGPFLIYLFLFSLFFSLREEDST